MIHAFYLALAVGAFAAGYFCGSDDVRTGAWRDTRHAPKPRLSERPDIRAAINWRPQ